MIPKTISSKKNQPGKDAVQVLKDLVKTRPEFEHYFQEARINSIIAQLIYDARNNAGLTQKEFADLVGTTPLVISQMEDANYEGYALGMLQRIAGVMKKRIEIRLIPVNDRKPKKSATGSINHKGNFHERSCST